MKRHSRHIACHLFFTKKTKERLDRWRTEKGGRERGRQIMKEWVGERKDWILNWRRAKWKPTTGGWEKGDPGACVSLLSHNGKGALIKRETWRCPSRRKEQSLKLNIKTRCGRDAFVNKSLQIIDPPHPRPWIPLLKNEGRKLPSDAAAFGVSVLCQKRFNLIHFV